MRMVGKKPYWLQLREQEEYRKISQEQRLFFKCILPFFALAGIGLFVGSNGNGWIGMIMFNLGFLGVMISAGILSFGKYCVAIIGIYFPAAAFRIERFFLNLRKRLE